MSFLPQELSGTKERTCCFFPAHRRNTTDCILSQTVDWIIFLIEITEQSFPEVGRTQRRSGSFRSTTRYPCYFRCKTFYVVFFFLQKRFRNKHRHVYILYTCLFESAVKFMLDVFSPDFLTCRFNCHASFYTCVAAQLCFFTTSIYHCAKSSSMEVMASTNFFAIVLSPFLNGSFVRSGGNKKVL